MSKPHSLNVIRALFGGNIVPIKRAPNAKSAATLGWTLSGFSALCPLRAIFPFLYLKKEQAQIMISMMEKPWKRQRQGGIDWTPEVSSSWEVAKQAISRLNAKGSAMTLGAFAQLVGDQWMTTQRDLLGERWERFTGTWPASGSLRNGVVFERPTLELRMYAPGGSVWPTSRAEDSESAANCASGALDSLTGETRNWGTPRVTTNGGNPSPQCTGKGSRLEDQSGAWGTPNAHERTHTARQVDHGTQLANQADSWLTPHGMNGQDHTGKQGRGGEFAKMATEWQTPATDSFRSRGGDWKDEMGLDQQARFWPTPTSRDEKNPNMAESKNYERKVREGWTIDLNDCAANWGMNGMSSLPAPPIPYGPQSSETSRGSLLPSQRKKLNPLFVIWMMGWPQHWLAPVPISSGRAETELWLCRLRSLLQSLLDG